MPTATGTPGGGGSTLRSLTQLAKKGYRYLTGKKKKKKPTVDIGLGSTPQARAIAKHNKALAEALKY